MSIITETENIHREYVSDGTSRIYKRLTKQIAEKLREMSDKYEPETNGYINGNLDVWINVDIKANHRAYEGYDHE